MGRVPGTDGTHTRGCPAKILYVYWFFSSPIQCNACQSKPLCRSVERNVSLFFFLVFLCQGCREVCREFLVKISTYYIFQALVARAIRNAIRANRFARIIRNRNPYFYSASGRFARITRMSDSRESPDSRESCESIRANHATKFSSVWVSKSESFKKVPAKNSVKEGNFHRSLTLLEGGADFGGRLRPKYVITKKSIPQDLFCVYNWRLQKLHGTRPCWMMRKFT